MTENKMSLAMLLGGLGTIVAACAMALLELPFWPAAIPIVAAGAWDIVGTWRNA